MFKLKKLVAFLSVSVIFSLASSWAGERAPATEEQKKAQLFVKGAQLWPNYCGSCHNARGPAERSPAEWDLIMMHMRSIGNIPAQDSQAILEFLQKR